MKIYVVTSRYGSELEEPLVFKTENEAYNYAEKYVYNFVRERYIDMTYDEIPEDADEEWVRECVANWAEQYGYAPGDLYFWDGGYDAIDVNVTECNIDI